VEWVKIFVVVGGGRHYKHATPTEFGSARAVEAGFATARWGSRCPATPGSSNLRPFDGQRHIGADRQRIVQTLEAGPLNAALAQRARFSQAGLQIALPLHSVR